jgi:hypothetical protein
VSKWGYALLITFVVLGLSPVRWHKAMRLSALVTVALIGYAVHSAGAI